MLCGNCLTALEVANKVVRCNGYRMYILYVYNTFIESMLFQYKEGRDIALAPVFFHMIVYQLQIRFRNYVIVLMPSSKEKTLERGFHSLYEMVCYCKLPIIDPFYKIENRKQSLQSFENRKKISQVIKLKPDYILPNKKLLLLDDVCTSGSTIAHAYHLLKHHKCKIDAFVLSAHPRFILDCEKKKCCKKGKFRLYT